MDRSAVFERDELEKFVASLSSYNPALPDSLVRYHLSRAGFRTDDLCVQRLISLAAQKFLADIADEAINHSRMRQSHVPATRKTNAQAKERVVLTVDDLERALREYGVVLKKPPYFADTVGAGGGSDEQSSPVKNKP